MIETLQDIRETVIAMIYTELSCTESELTDGQVHISERNPDTHETPRIDFRSSPRQDRNSFTRDRRNRLC